MTEILKGPDQPKGNASGILVVPDLSAAELMGLLRDELRPTILEPQFAGWDFYRTKAGKEISGRGKTFEWQRWAATGEPPWDGYPLRVVRTELRREGFSGHVGAFVQWLRLYGTEEAWCASIPENRGCWRIKRGLYYAPFACRNGTFCKVSTLCVRETLPETTAFIGFRELPDEPS